MNEDTPITINSTFASTPWFDERERSLDRAQGCLLGQIAGDALGALVEFKTKADIARDYPSGLHELADGGPWNIIAGQATDDSELAIALARTLVRDQAYDPKRVFEAYVAWRRSGPFDIGGTTSQALDGPLRDRTRLNGASQANGSLMRVSPIGIFAAGDPERAAALAAIDSGLTHPHKVCVSACAAFTAAIAIGITGGSRADMMAAAEVYAGDGEGAETIRGVLRAAVSAPPAEFQDKMGWVLIAFQNAFHHLTIGSTIEHAVSKTVAEGGDTDTNGAIVGALVGATDGLQTMPTQWVASIRSCKPARAHGAPQPRPEAYWPHDSMELAAALLAAG